MLKNEEWYNYIPISINDTYGDPFIPSQIDNTIEKLKSLESHKMPICIITKAPYNEKVINKLKNLKHNHMIVVMYSLTNLNEGGISYNNRLKFITELNKIFGQTAIMLRPIIEGRNDDIKTLTKIVKSAKDLNCHLILGGLHSESKRKVLNSTIEKDLIQLCDQYNVKSFYKSSCCAAYMKNVPCWVHNLGTPKNIDVVDSLGYDYEIIENKLVLNIATAGDLNYLRLITNSLNTRGQSPCVCPLVFKLAY